MCMCVCVCVCIPQGCLPLVLMFDIKEDIEVEAQYTTALMEQLDVFISIKPKPKQPSKVRPQTCSIPLALWLLALWLLALWLAPFSSCLPGFLPSGHTGTV